MQNQNILVTGAAGFIGSHVAEALLLRGEHVVGIDELNDYYPVRFKRHNLRALLKYPNFEFMQADIRQADGMKSLFEQHRFAAVAHLAARAGVRPSIEQPSLYVETNILGTLNLLEAAKLYPPQNFVFTSSSSVYGDSRSAPYREQETSSDQPVSPYAATKKGGELLCHSYHVLHQLNINVVRPFTVYGPRGRPDMAPWLFLQAALEQRPIRRFGDGRSQRDYTYIDDFVAGFIAALDRPLGFEIFNLGNSHAVDLNTLIDTISRVSGRRLTVHPWDSQAGDVRHTLADITKAQRLLGYQPQTTLADGLQFFHEWYLATVYPAQHRRAA